MNKKEQKELINGIIKRLETIRDTSEIEEVDIYPFHIAEEARWCDGTIYGTAYQDICIKYTKGFMKKHEFDEWQKLK